MGFLRITNCLIISISALWAVSMSLLIIFYDSSYIKIISTFTILLNIGTTIFCLLNDNKKQSLETRIYVDNFSVFFLVLMFPVQLFYGYPIQVLFSIIITHCFLRKRTKIYDILLYTSTIETVLFIILMHSAVLQTIFNTLSMSLLIVIIYLLRQQLKVDPSVKFKKALLETHNMVKHEIIECISPMRFYIKNLKDDEKEKMQKLIDKLQFIAQNNTSNFDYLISLVRSTLSYTTKKNIAISYTDQTTKNLEIDSYVLLLILYVMAESSASNAATEIIVKFNNSTIEVVDNGIGYDTKSKEFVGSQLKSAIDLVTLFDIPIIFSSIKNSGTVVSMGVS